MEIGLREMLDLNRTDDGTDFSAQGCTNLQRLIYDYGWLPAPPLAKVSSIDHLTLVQTNASLV
jgi:hypothetical protein